MKEDMKDLLMLVLLAGFFAFLFGIAAGVRVRELDVTELRELDKEARATREALAECRDSLYLFQPQDWKH